MAFIVDTHAVADYLGIEDEEIDPSIQRNINRQIPAAERFLESAIGKGYDTDDPRAKELAVMVTAELYNSRGIMSTRQEASLRRIAADFMLQLRLERRGE